MENYKRQSMVEDVRPFLVTMKGELVVNVIEAENLIGADKGGTSSDPYCVVKPKGSKSQKTKVIKKNLSPKWNETFKWKDITLKPGQILKFSVWDKDTLKKDDRLGISLIPVESLLATESIERWLSLFPQKKGEKARGQIHVSITFRTPNRPIRPPVELPTPPPRKPCAEILFNLPPPPPMIPEPPLFVEEVIGDDRAPPSVRSSMKIPSPLPSSLEIWRVEKGQIAKWPEEDYGKFYSGDCYLVLRTTYLPDPHFDIHFWIGREASSDEIDTVVLKANELEKAVDGAVQHREAQGAESDMFLSYFPNRSIVYLEGGIDSGWKAEKPDNYRARLLRIKGKKNLRVTQVILGSKSLNSGDCFILDFGLKIWQWNGKVCNAAERRKANMILLAFVNERTGKPQTYNIDEGEEPSDFWEVLGGKGPVASAEEGGDDDQAEVSQHQFKLYKLSDATGELKFEHVASGNNVKIDLLTSDDVYIFDAGVEIFVWIGKLASQEEKKNAMRYAQRYLDDFSRPCLTPITRLIEGGESDYFKQAFTF